MTSLDLPVAVVDLKAYDPDDYLLEEVGNCLFFFFFPFSHNFPIVLTSCVLGEVDSSE